jgi:two-component system chemotaxis sensor kinase CheA
VAEASDKLERLGRGLVRLEAAVRGEEPLAPLVDEMFRHAHSVKGMSAAMELEGISRLAHRAEGFLEILRRGESAPGPEAVDLLLSAVDALQSMVASAAQGESPEPDAALLRRLAGAAAGHLEPPGEEAPPPAPPAAPPAGPEPAGEAPGPPAGEDRGGRGGAAPRVRRRLVAEVEIAAACPIPAVRGFLVLRKLGALGELLGSTPAEDDLRAGRLPERRVSAVLETAEPAEAVERALSQISDIAAIRVREEQAPPPPAAAAPAAPAREAPEGGRTVRVRADLLDSFLDAVGELILATSRIRELARAVPEAHRPPLEDGVDRLHATVKDLHDKVMAARMTPLRLVTDPLPRAARDLARRSGKQVEVEVRGAEIELDRAILDELADPLVHLVRNAVDHGIEPPHLRQLSGKPPTGRVVVQARRDRDRVVVEISDDGRGMDPARLRTAAVARGALGAEAAEALSDREALQLACLPGLSTAESVTDVSGRGVGMDAVKRAAEAVGGSLELDSEPGRGTRVALRLPLTVAVQPVLLVLVGEEVLGLPIAKVHGAAEAAVESLERSRGEPMLSWAEGLVPVRELAALLGLPRQERPGPRQVVVAEGDGERVGLAVDALLGQAEAVLKPLVRPLDRVGGLSAVTVLGSGRPVFILDVAGLAP